MGLTKLIIGLFAILPHIALSNALTVDTDYDVSLDLHRTQIHDTSATLAGATWVLEKPFGLFYGASLRVLASPVDGFSSAAREKSLSLYYIGPTIGWNLALHRYFGIAFHLLYGFGTAAYNENTGELNDDKTQKIKTQSSELQFVEPGLEFRFGSYYDMQMVLGAGTRILTKNAHKDRIPDDALGKPFVQLGVVKRMSEL